MQAVRFFNNKYTINFAGGHASCKNIDRHGAATKKKY